MTATQNKMKNNELTPTQMVEKAIKEAEWFLAMQPNIQSSTFRDEHLKELIAASAAYLRAAAELERVKKERDDYFGTLKSTCEKIGYTEEVAKAGESSVGTKVSDGISKMFDDLKRQVEELKESTIPNSDLLAALERSLRISKYVTAGTTVVKNIKHGGRKAQIQVRVTKDETQWFDIKRAGIKCS